jgi:hypothetical protein
METVRIAGDDQFTLWQPCCRCGTNARAWDRIAGKAICPACQEAVIQGTIEPIVLPTLRRTCSACPTVGSVTVQTFPRDAVAPLEFELCPSHLRGLLGRNLNACAYLNLRRQLAQIGMDIQEVFLLHGAFYDANGQALQPAGEAEF